MSGPDQSPATTRELSGLVCLVTGASSGIGRATALELGRRGAEVALLARSKDKLDSAAAAVQEFGRKVLAIPADVSRSQDVKNAVDQVAAHFGKIDVLVNNAGTTRDNLLLRMSEEEWDEVVNTNLKSAYLLSKAVARIFLRQKGGRIINITSVVGLIGNPGQANYAASKGGLIALTFTLAKELSSRGILVNAVAPGFIETPMTVSLPEAARAAALGTIPLARFGKPEEIAQVVAFLAGPGASYINGTVIRVDGGLGI
ncbi:MAG: 3-oxoacyl-[acyl-carrier-protein] reductase [Planctomycetes bacterium]|nr:3-oxoacyl-[acyl-carrier-protein] reductase [Planctomycetota bacterium]